MKKYLKWIKNERGQMLLFVLISASIIFMLFTTSIKLYMNTIEDTQALLDQLEVETLIQMSKVDLLSNNEKEQSNFYFVYPNGEIEIKLNNKYDTRYIVNNEMTLYNHSIYETTYEIDLE